MTLMSVKVHDSDRSSALRFRLVGSVAASRAASVWKASSHSATLAMPSSTWVNPSLAPCGTARSTNKATLPPAIATLPQAVRRYRQTRAAGAGRRVRLEEAHDRCCPVG